MVKQGTKKQERNIPFGKKCRYLAEAFLTYILYGFFRLFSIEMASNMGGFILRKIGVRMGVSRVALKNIQLAFPDKTAEEHQKILIGMWDNLGRVIAEYSHLDRIFSHVELIGEEYLLEVKKDNKEAMFVGAHLGNWEILPVAPLELDVPLHGVYRKPNNPWVDRLLEKARGFKEGYGISKGAKAGRQMLSALRKSESLGILVDQKLNGGISVPFFGREAMTTPVVAQFALSLKAPIHMSRVERIDKTRFRLTIYPAMKIENTGDKKADTLKIMTDINQELEKWITEQPEQWLWLHRRWPKE